MTSFELTENVVNVVLVNNKPVRCVPVKVVYSDEGRSGDWHGWSYTVYETKTGKYILGIVSWSCVQGERDYLTTFLAGDLAALYKQMDCENFVQRKIAVRIALEIEVVPTV